MRNIQSLKFENILIILSIIFLIYSSEAAEKDIKIIQSDASGIVFEYTPRFSTQNSIYNDSDEFIDYKFEGEINDQNFKSGSPLVKFRDIVIRFPGLKNNNAEVIASDYETITNILLPPVPKIETDDQGFLIPKYIKDINEYQTNEYLPGKIISLTNVGITRNAILGNIHLYPLQYNPATSTLKKYNRIVVRVNFSQPEVKVIPNFEDNLLVGVGLNYETAKNWFVFSFGLKKVQQTNSVLSTGVWYKFNISEEGIYKLDGNRLISAGIPASTNPNTIKIYNNSGYEPPFDAITPYPDDLIENAVFVHDDGTPNTLDGNDYILFYARGTTGWKYSPITKTFSHYINRFDEKNVYWLTYDGLQSKRMTEIQSLNNPNTFEPNTVTGKTFREDEKVNFLKSGVEWLGQQFNINDMITYVVSLPGLDVQNPIIYNLRLGARSSTQSFFEILERQQSLGFVTIEATNIDPNDYNAEKVKFSTWKMPRIPNFSEPRSELKLKFTSNSSTAIGYLDWYELFYSRFLTAQNDVFAFHSHDTSSIIKYSIGGFSSNDIKVFDVTEFDSVKIISSPIIMANSVSFQIEGIAGRMREIFSVGQNGYKSPPNLTKVNNQNLLGKLTSGDSIKFVIISHSEFKSAANRLKTHRETAGSDKLLTLIADVDEIYNEFGGGLSSPMAIRNFLKYAYNSLPANSLTYVLLLGDGDFNYRRISSSGPNWIPPWETIESYVDIKSYASEDPFVIFDNSGRLSLAIGRLPVRSLSEANAVIDKIIEYENNPVRDPWKMRATYVADDGWVPGTYNDEGSTHTTHAESIAGITPDFFEKRKIYIVEYPTVIATTGRRKPTANQAIVKQINEGTLIINFSGHGNPRLWTHEQVFVRETDYPLLQNKNKYFYLIAATCDFSKFDAADDQSGGEILMNKTGAGAIGVFSATRAVYALYNLTLNIALFNNLFNYDIYGHLIPQRLGDAIFKTKQSTDFIIDNARKFFLLGDPSTRLNIPKRFGTIDSINNLSTSQTITLKALQKVNIKGIVQEENSNLPSDFSGTAQVVVYDANKNVIIPEWSMTYKSSGGVIFRGENTISSGIYQSEFIIPKDISYDTLNGRITLYFWDDKTDGLGYTQSFKILGTDTSAINDNKGPEINLYLNSRSFRPGDVVPESPLLIAELIDESGINASGTGIGHRIEAWLDNQGESIDLTPYYKSKLDTYREGTIEYRLENLSPGTHTLKIRAWDVFNNASTNETIFDVLIGRGLRISEVFNYPNPFSDNTTFTFNHNQIIPVDAEIKIYTVAGRLLQSIKRINLYDQFVRIEWDGRDRDGNQLANGIYLYKVILKTQDGRFTSESLGKLSILK